MFGEDSKIVEWTGGSGVMEFTSWHLNVVAFALGNCSIVLPLGFNNWLHDFTFTGQVESDMDQFYHFKYRILPILLFTHL